MVIKLAKTAGFCMGVRRALNNILYLGKQPAKKIYTWGPLIHNEQTLRMLSEKNIYIADKKTDITDSTIVIRAHGINPETRKYLKNKTSDICDATCPDVGKVHSIVKKYSNEGYHIIIVGDKGHAEVTGIVGFAGDNYNIVENEQDIDNLPDNIEKICVVAQTTQFLQNYNNITSKIKQKYSNVEIIDTICKSTKLRQKETINLAKSVDAMIVVGSRTSANTNRLAQISEDTGTPTFLTSGTDDLKKIDINKYEDIGITAGASAPNWLITLIIDEIKQIQITQKNIFLRAVNYLIRFLLISNMFISLGAMGLSFTACLILNISPKNPKWIIYPLITFFYIQAMQLLNYFTDKIVLEYHQPIRKKFYKKYSTALIITGLLSAVISSILGFTLDSLSGLCIAILSILGLLFHLNVVPADSFIKIKRIKDIPCSKDLLFALAWSVVIVLIPSIKHTSSIFNYKTVIYFFFVFIIVFTRSVLFDIRELHGDIIIGRETLPVIIGPHNSMITLMIINLILLFVLLFSCHLLLTALVLVILYSFFYLFLYHKRIIYQNILCEFIVDAKFILTGIIGYLYYIFT